MKITVLGSGTSHGVPVIGCSCSVCTSKNPKNKRTRSSIWIQAEGLSILVDTSTDFRTQAVREGIRTLDLILYTHAHADHIHGLDDIRPLCRKVPIPVWGSKDTIEEILRRFDYIFRNTQKGGGKPKIDPHIIKDGPIRIGNLKIEPIPLKHGSLDILGYRLGPFAYLTDCSGVPGTSMDKLKGIQYVIIDGLRHEPHATHFSVGEAVEVIRELGPEKAYLTHICHSIEHKALAEELPPGIEPAWDGLIIDC